MEYFVRYARFGPSGAPTKTGWRLRLFATANEARTFSRQLVVGGWRVEAGRCGEATPQAPGPVEIASGRQWTYPAPPAGRASA